MASKWRDRNSSDVQAFLDSVSPSAPSVPSAPTGQPAPIAPAAPPINIAKAQTLARSSGNPQAQRVGQGMLQEAAQQQERAGANAQRQAGIDARRMQREAEQAAADQAKAVEAARARDVRVGAAKGIKVETDIETGKRSLATHPDGAPKYTAGPIKGAPMVPDVVTSAFTNEDGSTQAVPSSNPMISDDGGAASATGGTTQTTMMQQVQDDRGQPSLAVPDSTTDAKTGVQTISAVDPSTGQTVKTAVGIDAQVRDQARKTAEFKQREQDISLRANMVAQARAQFTPRWEPVKREFDDAAEAVNKIPPTFRLNAATGKMEKIDPRTDSAVPFNDRELTVWQKTKKAAEERLAAAKTKHDAMSPAEENMDRNEKQIAADKLKLTEERIRLESGATEGEGGWAKVLARQEAGEKVTVEEADALLLEELGLDPNEHLKVTVSRTVGGTTTTEEMLKKDYLAAKENNGGEGARAVDAGSMAAPEMVGPPKPLIPTDDPIKAQVLVDSFQGLANPDQFKVGATGDGYAFIQRGDRGNVGFIEQDKATGKPLIVLGNNANADADIRQLVAFGGVGGNPVYMRDAGARDTVAEAQYLRDVYAAVNAPSPLNLDQGAVAKILADMGATTQDIGRKVRAGEMSVQNGETIMRELYGTTLKASDPLAPATLGKWLEDAEPETKQRWAKINAEKDTEGRNGMVKEFINDWFIENRWKPGVNFQSRQLAEKSMISDKRTGEKAAALGGTLLEAGGSMIGMLSAPVMITVLTGGAWQETLTDSADQSSSEALLATIDNYGRGSKNTWRGWEANRKKWLTAEGGAKFKDYQDSIAALRAQITTQDVYPEGLNDPKFRADYKSRVDAVLDSAMAVHATGLESGWEVTREDLEQLTWMANSYALSGDASLMDSFASSLMEDHGTRQAQDYTAELTQGRGKFMSGLIAGAHAPPEEIGVEMLSTALTAGVGKVVFGGAKAAAAGTSVAASAGRMARFRAFNLGLKEDVLKLGMVTDTLAKPASLLGKASNMVVKATKVGAVNSLTEAGEEAAMGMADRNATMSSVAGDAGVGALAGFFMGPVMGAPLALKAASRRNYDTNQAAAKFANAYNQAERGSEGFVALTPEQAKVAMAMVPPQVREALLAQQSEASGKLLQATAQMAAISAGDTTTSAAQLDQAISAAQAEFQQAKASGSMEAQFDAQAKVVAANKAKQRFTANPEGFAADAFARAQAGVLKANDLLSTEAAMRSEAVQAIQALPAEEQDFGSAVAKVASGRADLLTSSERKAAGGAVTASGKPFFASVQGRDVITDAGRADAKVRFPQIGALIQTTESQAIFDAAITQTPTNEQNPQGQAPAAGGDVSQNAGNSNTSGQRVAGSNISELEANDYLAFQASGQAGFEASIGDVVLDAALAGRPFSASMADAAGFVPGPAGYTRQGKMWLPPAQVAKASPTPQVVGTNQVPQIALRGATVQAAAQKVTAKGADLLYADSREDANTRFGLEAKERKTTPIARAFRRNDGTSGVILFPAALKLSDADLTAVIDHELIHLEQYAFEATAEGQKLAKEAEGTFTQGHKNYDEAFDKYMAKEYPSWSKLTARSKVREATRAAIEALEKGETSHFKPGFFSYLKGFLAHVARVFSGDGAIKQYIAGIQARLEESQPAVEEFAPIRPPTTPAHKANAKTLSDSLKAEIEGEFPNLQGRIEVADNNNLQPTGGVYADFDGSIVLNIPDVAVRVRLLGVDAAKLELRAAIIAHEARHLAQIEFVENNRADGETFMQAWNRVYGASGIHGELANIPGMIERLKEIYDGKAVTDSGASAWEQIATDANKAAEGVRILLEIVADPSKTKEQVELFELLRAKGMQKPKMVELIEGVIAKIKEMIASLASKDAELFKPLKEHLEGVEQLYQAMIDSSSSVTAVQADAKPNSSEETPDVDATDFGNTPGSENAPPQAEADTPTAIFTTGQALEAAFERHPFLKADSKLTEDLFDLTADLADLVEAMDPEARRAFLDNAFDEWVSELEQVKEARAKEAAAAKAQEKRTKAQIRAEIRRKRISQKADDLIGMTRWLNAMDRNGMKIELPSSLISILQAKKDRKEKLSYAEQERYKTGKGEDGIPRKSWYVGGGINEVLREIIGRVTAPHGSGRAPDDIAKGLEEEFGQTVATDELLQAIGDELRGIANRKWTLPEEMTDAEIAAWEAQQIANEVKQNTQPYATMDDAHGFAIDAFGPESAIAQKIGDIAELSDRFSRYDMPDVRAGVAAEFARHAQGKSIPEWDAENAPLEGAAATAQKVLRAHTPESLRAALEALPVVDTGSALFSSPSPEAVATDFRKDLEKARNGQLPQNRTLQLGVASQPLTLAGIPQGPVYMRQEVALSKPHQENHPYPPALLDMLPEMLQDPILIHESWTEKDSFVALLDAKDRGENLVAALHFRKTKNGIEITQVASVYPRQNHKILQAFKRTAAGAEGKITYYHKEKTRDWLNQNSGSNSPQYWIGHLGRGKNLSTNADIVNETEEGPRLMSSPAPGEFSFNQTTDAGDKSQKGLNFDAPAATPAAAPASPGRTRPKTLIEFAKPYRGPSGASLVAYEWKHELKETIDKRGEDSAVRVSNWNEAATNWQTGREIVHQFHVTSRNGETRVTSLETALKLLGYTSENGVAARPVRSMASTLRNRSLLAMEAEALRPVVEEGNAAAARYEKEKAALERERMPKPVFTLDGTTPIMRIGPLEKFGQLAGTPESFAKRSEYDLRALENEWRAEEAAKRAGGKGNYQAASKLRELEDRIAKLDRKIQEQSALGSENQAGDNLSPSSPDLFSTIATLPPGPMAKFVENTTKAFTAAPEGSTARENIAKAAAKREDMPHHGKVQKMPQGMMDFGMSGSFGTKDQPGLNFGDNGRPAIKTTDGKTLEAPGPVLLFSSPAYHGTPHKVDKFSTDKIGTGEGAQAYGWGLYFADSREVAAGYRDALSGVRLLDATGKALWEVTDNPAAIKILKEAQSFWKKGKTTVPSIIQDIKSRREQAEFWAKDGTNVESNRAFVIGADEAIRLLQGGAVAKVDGNLYRVMLKVDDEDLLDWDKPLSEQSQKVKAALSFMPPIKAMLGGMRGKSWGDPSVHPSFKGSDLIEEVGASGKQQEASRALAAAGIRGIRYLDGNSRISDAQIELSEKTVAERRAEMEADPSPVREQMLNMAERYLEGLKAKATQGSYNYVIFDASDIEITEENGTPVQPAALFSSPAMGGQGAFDFGTTGSFNTRNQPGFDFSGTVDAPANEAAPIEPGTPDFNLLPREDKKAIVIAKTKAKSAEKAGISDFGEKLGGARKDSSIKTGESARPKKKNDKPGWFNRYEVNEVVAESKPSSPLESYLSRSSGMPTGDVGRFVINDKRKTDWRGNPERATRQSFATREEAEAFIPMIEVSRNHRVRKGEDSTYGIWRTVSDRKRVQVVKQTFDAEKEAMEFMAKNAADIIETKTSWREELIVKPENAVRSGPERRKGPATAEMFQEAFGFRGVEFGNWMRQAGDGKERQEVLNHAYDGLIDLAELLGIPPMAISLNGELGLAFGARGQGLSGAKAHYEPDYVVINLTKMSGAGSLAHEWIHALDHYLGRQDGRASSQLVKNKDGDMVLNPGAFEENAVSTRFSRESKVRDEVKNAFVRLMDTIMTKSVEYVEDSNKAENFVSASRKALEDNLQRLRKEYTRDPDPRWEKRRKPATEAQRALFESIADRLMNGQDLVTDWRGIDSNARGGKTYRWTNDTLEQLGALHKQITNRSGFDTERKGWLDDLRGYMERYRQRIAMLESAAASETKVKKVPTDFSMNAKRIDQGSASDYWNVPHEMLARGFSAYVEDRIADTGGTSDFLSYGSDNSLAKYRMFNVKPFPEGPEREAINEKFDKLFGVIETRETDKGIALFSSPAPSDGVGKALQELARHDEVFRYPVSSKSSLRAVMAEVFPDARFEGDDTRPDEAAESGADKRTVFSTIGKDGQRKLFYVYETDETNPDVWIDVSRLTEGDSGSGIYAAVGNYAHNAGGTFIGDPAGLSEAATVRRTSAMLSLALRFGTTEFMEPSKEQLAGGPEKGIAALEWKGNDQDKVRALIQTFLSNLHAKYPGIRNASYDFGTGQFLDRRGVPIRREREQNFDTASKDPRGRAARAGEATLRRGIFLQSLVSSEGGQGPNLLGQLLNRTNQSVTDAGLGRLFSSPSPLDPQAVASYLQDNGTPTAVVVSESERVFQALAPNRSGRLADDRGAYSQGDFFTSGQPAPPSQGEQIADAGASAIARAKDRAGRDALSDDLIRGMSGDWAALAREVNARGRASSILADLINREIPVWNVNGTILDTPDAVHAVMLPIRSPYFESLKVMVLDGNMKAVHSQILTVGSVNEAVANPAEILGNLARLREVHGKKYTSIILSHNHPSGDPSPSRADEQITLRLNTIAEMAGWSIADHVITNGEKYFSFREMGLLGGSSVKEAPFTPRKDKGAQAPQIDREDRQAPWEAVKMFQLKSVDTPERIAAVAAHLRNANPDAAHLLYVNTRLQLLAVERVDVESILDQKQLTQTLLAARGREGASGFIVDYPGGRTTANRLTLKVSEVANLMGMRFIDAVTITSTSGRYESAREAGLVQEDSAIRPTQATSNLAERGDDLFTATNAPDATEKLGQVKVGTMNALGAYRALTAKRDAGKALSAKEQDQLLSAEEALGQKLAFDMESVKGEAPATGKDSLQVALPVFGQNRRDAQDEMSRAGEIDRSGQISLLSSPTQDAAVQIALEAMPPIYRQVFEAVNAGSTPEQVMDKFKISEKAVTSILNQVRSRITAATAAADGPLTPNMRDGLLDGGRPDLALSTNPQIAAIDQIRNESEVPDVRAWDEVNAQAAAMLENNYQGTYDALLAKARDLQPMTDMEVSASKMIIAKETLAGKIHTFEDRVKLAMMIHGYRDIGTETARALAIRRDPHKSPAERHAMFIAEALFTPDAETRKALRGAKKGQQESILAGWMARVDAIKADMLAQGVDIDASLAAFNEAQQARKQAADESPRVQAAVEEAIRKLSPLEKMVIEAIRNGALLDKIQMLTGLDAETILDINARFNAKIRESMVAAAKRFLAGSLASSPVDMMTQILAELGVWGNDVIDNRKADFVDRRKEILNPKPRKQKPATPKKVAPQLPGLTPEQQAAIDAAFERFQNTAPAQWKTFWQTEMATLAPMIGQTSFEQFKGEAIQPWRDLWQTEMDGIATPAARISFEDWAAKPATAETVKRERDMFAPPVSTTTGERSTDPRDQGRLLPTRPDLVSTTTGTFDLNDPLAVKAVLDAFSVARGGKMDALMEFWKMSILTGPQTHLVNTSSNLLNSAYNLLPRRAAEAAINNILGVAGQGSDKAATFGEFVPMAQNLRKGLHLAARNMLRSWKMETRTFEAYARAEALQLDFTGVGNEYIPPALSGKIGKIMRSLSFRAMTAADEFQKSLYGQMEAAAQAHRIAKIEEKLSGDAYAARINELMETGSVAWIRAIDEAKRITFQQNVDGTNPQIIRRLDQLAELAKTGRNMPWIGRPLTFFLPFIDTPLNIFKEAVEVTPIGGFLAVVDGIRSLRRRVFAGKLTPEAAKAEAELIYNRARLVRDMTNQTIGLGLFFAIQGMLKTDDGDDDDLPMITGTVPYKTTRRGERDNASAVMPAQSLRIGGVQFSYQRFEPFATVLASTVDLVQAMNRNGGFKPAVASEWLNGFKNQVKDKTFLQGISNLINALEDPDRFAERISAGIVTGFVPNIIRQPLREADQMLRDTGPRADEGFLTAISKRVGYSLVPQSAPAKQDVWGNDIRTNRGETVGNRATDLALRIFDPTNLTVNPDIDPIDAWIFRWNLSTADSKERIAIEPISNSVSGKVPGEKRARTFPLTQQEQAEANREAGRQARESLGEGWDEQPLDAETAQRIIDTVRRSQEIHRGMLRMRKLSEATVTE